MPEVREYDVLFERSVTNYLYRRIKAYDAADALVQAKLMIDRDSRLDATALGPLHGTHVGGIAPVEEDP